MVQLDRAGPSDLKTRRGPSEDLVGRRFGRLTVLEYLGFSRTAWSSYWSCRCDCGRLVAVGKALRKTNSPTRSCGCIAADRASSQHWKGCGELSHTLFRRIVNRAKDDDIELDVTIDQLWELFQAQGGRCSLSGLEIKFGRYGRGDRVHGQYSRLNTASLDRIDSAKGYVISNVQWVHKDINKMKGVFSQEDFIALCRKVAEHRP